MSEYRTGSPKGAARTVRSLRELPQEMPPGRDLWPRIEAQLIEAGSAEAGSGEAGAPRAQTAEPHIADPQTSELRRAPVAWSGWRVRLAAAVGLLTLSAALTTGVWITHRTMGSGRVPTDPGVSSAVSPQTSPLDARGRAAMLRSLNARLQSLPPPSRQKVLADLQVIEQSMQDIQGALGRDPGNALLREMLSETYQDEQHLFATVQEAGVWTQEADSGQGSI